ncbi:MAG: hypothetical protein KDD06_12695 [Phaeodactylibacter sp.]|nr:hypothetical protein [Phaeodactylibacter sp.]MCB9265654.1 carbohydrate esterase [Lewinellaceae bacterium]MCB9290916.1 carbohydrate esterase [Lewinellaceae bacterium]
MTGEKPSPQHTAEDKESLTIRLATAEDSSEPVYIAGNFNGWKTGDDQYRMARVGPRAYTFVFEGRSLLPGELEYKFHRGSWESAELDEHGNPAPNRMVEPRKVKEVQDFVPRWKKAGLAYDPAFLPEIQVISEQFEIPQLIKTRRIAALLPHDYRNSDQRYPVLYLQDGQNLFDDYAPFGNWGVDKKLAVMAERGIGDIIIISIDHAEKDRIAEFTPSYRTKLGSGDGKKYVRFLADTLKAYVDKHFRTLPEREFTGIGGSSMGGLISIYAGLMYPEVYGKLMIFSPSLWVMPNIHFHFLDFHDPQDMDIYLYGGEEESSNMVPNIRRFQKAFEDSGSAFVKFKLSVDPQGQHNEGRWGEEFPRAVEWLYFNKKET